MLPLAFEHAERFPDALLQRPMNSFNPLDKGAKDSEFYLLGEAPVWYQAIFDSVSTLTPAVILSEGLMFNTCPDVITRVLEVAVIKFNESAEGVKFPMAPDLGHQYCAYLFDCCRKYPLLKH